MCLIWTILMIWKLLNKNSDFSSRKLFSFKLDPCYLILLIYIQHDVLQNSLNIQYKNFFSCGPNICYLQPLCIAIIFLKSYCNLSTTMFSLALCKICLITVTNRILTCSKTSH
jgi:hypothetical protein